MGVRRPKILVFAIGVLALVGGGAAAAPANAADVVAGVRDAVPEGATIGTARLDCASFTGEVAEYAQEHGYCPAPGDGVRARSVQAFDCGTSWIYTYNKGIRGRQFVSYGFRSSKGIVSGRNLALGTSQGGGWPDSLFMWSDYYDSGERFVGNFDSGSIQSASMSGWIRLWWGGTCTIPPISDSTVV